MKLFSALFMKGFYPDATGAAAQLRDPDVAKYGDVVPVIMLFNLEVLNKRTFAVDRALVVD